MYTKNIYDRAVTSVRTSRGITSEFPITINLHRKSALSLHGIHWNYCIYIYIYIFGEKDAALNIS